MDQRGLSSIPGQGLVPGLQAPSVGEAARGVSPLLLPLPSRKAMGEEASGEDLEMTIVTEGTTFIPNLCMLPVALLPKPGTPALAVLAITCTYFCASVHSQVLNTSTSRPLATH